MLWKRIENHLELGCVHGALFPETLKGEGQILETASRILHDGYFNRIEIGHIKDDAIRAQFKEKLKISRMKATYLSQPKIFIMNLNSSSLIKEERKRAVQELMNSIDEAAVIGADSMAFASGPRVTSHYDESISALGDSILELATYAEDRGINLLLELFDYDVDKKRLIGSTKDALKLYHQLAKSINNFSFMVDLSHIPLQHESIDDVKALANKVGHVHIGNCVLKEEDPRFGDKHPYFGYHNGEIDVKQIVAFLQMLEQIGYLSPGKKAKLSFEIIPAEQENVEDILQNAKRTLNQAWNEFTINDLSKELL
jgi:sugar phosphate isomerase/epimerase